MEEGNLLGVSMTLPSSLLLLQGTIAGTIEFCKRPPEANYVLYDMKTRTHKANR